MIELPTFKSFSFYALGLLVLYLIFQSYKRPRITRHGKALRKPPNSLPILGNGLLFLRPRRLLLSWFTTVVSRYPLETLSISVPSLPPGVIISSPECLDYVFQHEDIFEKGDFFKQRSWDLFGHGIINADGKLWKMQRKAGLDFLKAKNLGVLTGVALPRYLGESVERLGMTTAKEGKGGEREVVDLQEVAHELTTATMGKMAYDMEMHADDDFTLAFEHASGATAERFQNPLWRFTEMFTGAKLRTSLKTVKSFGQTIVGNAVSQRKLSAEDIPKEDKVDEVSGSLINSLLDAIEDEKLVADAALNYLSAGRDTVAQALTWTFYLLIKHPTVLSRLRQSVIDSNPGFQQENPSEASMRAHLTPDNLAPAKFPYILAIFNESLRLYPPVPFEIKQVQRDCTLPDDTFLPASSVVVWCPWAMNRSAATWGPDAEEFRPERWLSEDGTKILIKSAAVFPVFNGGARLCLGKKMAESMAVLVIATWAMLFDFEKAFEGNRTTGSSLTLPMEGGLPVYVKMRSL